MVATKHITFLTRCTWYFSPFCLLFMVLCWYIVYVLGIFQVGASVRGIRTKNRKKWIKDQDLYSWSSPWRFPWRGTHGRHLASKKSQKGEFCTHEAMTCVMGFKRHLLHKLHAWRSPWGYGVRHEAMTSSMNFEARKIETEIPSHVSLQRIILPLIQHDVEVFLSVFSSINMLRF